jgi:hypothetical protein
MVYYVVSLFREDAVHIAMATGAGMMADSATRNVVQSQADVVGEGLVLNWVLNVPVPKEASKVLKSQ